MQICEELVDKKRNIWKKITSVSDYQCIEGETIMQSHLDVIILLAKEKLYDTQQLAFEHDDLQNHVNAIEESIKYCETIEMRLAKKHDRNK